MKANYPSLAKKCSFKGKNESNSKKSYIAWDDSEVSSSPDSENEGKCKLRIDGFTQLR